jgi:hypothetical protein
MGSSTAPEWTSDGSRLARGPSLQLTEFCFATLAGTVHGQRLRAFQAMFSAFHKKVQLGCILCVIVMWGQKKELFVWITQFVKIYSL